MKYIVESESFQIILTNRIISYTLDRNNLVQC